jgi:hypothetical protein
LNVDRQPCGQGAGHQQIQRAMNPGRDGRVFKPKGTGLPQPIEGCCCRLRIRLVLVPGCPVDPSSIGVGLPAPETNASHSNNPPCLVHRAGSHVAKTGPAASFTARHNQADWARPVHNAPAPADQARLPSP